jgi:hypothetical protein
MEANVLKPRFALLFLALFAGPIETLASEVVAAADGGPTRRRAARSPGLPQSSDQLIEAALASGEISEETALVYRVLADFGDERLPAQFRGSLDTAFGSNAAALAITRWDSFSDENQNLLLPFVVPPFTVGSWTDSRGKSAKNAVPLDIAWCSPINHDQWEGWPIAQTSGGRVYANIWYQKKYPGDKAFVEILKPVIIDAITKYEALLGRKLLPDRGLTQPGCRGLDESIDIVLVDKRSTTIPFGADKTPSFILLNRAPVVQSVRAELTHELFHAFQYTYDGKDGWGFFARGIADYHWLMEATAQWAMDYVSGPTPGNAGEEQNALNHYLNRTRFSIDKPPDDNFKYGTYIFFLYLTRTYGNSIIKTLWETVALYADQLEVVDKVLAEKGGLEKVWPRFALALVNQGKFDQLREWDAITRAATPDVTEIVSDGGAEAAEEIELRPTPAAHMSARYFRYTAAAPGPRWIGFVNGLTFDITKRPVFEAGIAYHSYYFGNSHPEIKEATSLYLVPRIGGVWRDAIELTHVPFGQFCRDLPDERVDEMILVVANSHRKFDKVMEKNLPFIFIFSNIGCSEWKGSATYRLTNSPEECKLVKEAAFESTLKRMPGMAMAKFISVAEPTIVPPLYFSGTLTAGTWRSYAEAGEKCNECIVSGRSDNVAGIAVQGGFALYPWAPPGSKNVRRTFMNLLSYFPETSTCAPDFSFGWPIVWAFSGPLDPKYVNRDGSQFQGEIRIKDAPGLTEYRFTSNP